MNARAPSRMSAAALAAITLSTMLASSSGCFNPRVPEGAACSAEGLCPSGQTCSAVDNRCWTNPPDLPDAAPTPDADPCADVQCDVGLECDPASGMCVDLPPCMNGVLDPGETDVDCGGTDCPACAPGADCQVNDDCQSQICGPDSMCTTPVCGDNVVNGNEECDTGGESITCDSDCTMVECGDGVWNQQVEVCDEGGDTATCDSDCTAVQCGDSHANTAVEECDTAGDSMTCDANCTFAGCGDGDFNAAAGEECDDGNLSDADECTSTCQFATCTDNAQNYDESDVDCGGHCGATCAEGQSCATANDCTVGICTSTNVCQVPILFTNTDTGPNGTLQTWTVPADGLYEIAATGAEGGRATDGTVNGGCGALVRGNFNLTMGTQLQILVGQAGTSTPTMGGGGGGTFVVNGTTPLLIAGGGGGVRGGSTVDGRHGSTGNDGVAGSLTSDYSGSFVPGGTAGSGGNGGGGFGAGGGGYSGDGQNDGTWGNGGSAFVNGGVGGAALTECGGNLAHGGFGGGGSGNGCTGSGGGGGYSGGGSGRVSGGGGSFNVGAGTYSESPACTGGHGRVTIVRLM